MDNDEETSPENVGLVISDITAREGLYVPEFPTAQQLQEAAEQFPEIPPRQLGDREDRYSVSLSPGVVTVSRQQGRKRPHSDNYKAKTIIREWSKKSRANMVKVLAQLDYSQMLNDPSRLPALITLTYPKNWEEIVPDAQTARRHLKLLRQRYERTFGEMVAVWKMEFQRRGACHFHLFMAAPPDLKAFRVWLSENWTDILNISDPEEKAKHLAAGTGVDIREGLRNSDPKRVSVYFSKHNSANYGVKEYQNKPPDLWLEDNKSVGRFWGYFRLRKLTYTKEVSREDAVFISRLLRRLARAQSKPRKMRVPRVNQKTGVVKYRTVNRRARRHGSISGFQVVNDGSKIGALISQALTQARDKEPEIPTKNKPKPHSSLFLDAALLSHATIKSQPSKPFSQGVRKTERTGHKGVFATVLRHIKLVSRVLYLPVKSLFQGRQTKTKRLRL